MRSVGLIGFGAIGTEIVRAWCSHLTGEASLTTLLVRPQQVQDATACVSTDTLVTSELDAFLERDPDVVIEAAGHAAVAEAADKILELGCRLYVFSVGALADERLRSRLRAAATRGGGRIVIPAGALAGFDGLLSLRAAGISSVRYTSIKPVSAWRGTPAESVCELDELVRAQVIFCGTAREAARSFPRNANLAAAIALAGIGFEATQVRLIADPTATVNSSRLEAESNLGRLDVTVSSPGFPGNPKSSYITAMSVLAALHQHSGVITFC